MKPHARGTTASIITARAIVVHRRAEMHHKRHAAFRRMILEAYRRQFPASTYGAEKLAKARGFLKKVHRRFYVVLFAGCCCFISIVPTVAYAERPGMSVRRVLFRPGRHLALSKMPRCLCPFHQITTAGGRPRYGGVIHWPLRERIVRSA